MKKPPLTIRFNEKEEKELEQAKKILNIPKNTWGENSDTIKKSIKFVIEFHFLIYEKFLNDYPPITREYIKAKMTNI